MAGTGSSGTGSNALNQPHCVYIGINDTIYVCDTENHRIQAFQQGSSTGNTVAGGSGSGNSVIQLHQPVGMTFDKNGNLYVADKQNNRVQQFSPGSMTGTTVAGSGSSGNLMNQLNQPIGVAVDENLFIYVTDWGNGRVMKYSQNSTTGSDAFPGGSFTNPFGIYIQNGSASHIYTSDTNTKRVQLQSSGASNANFTITDAGNANWNEPAGIILDLYGNIYVADYQNKKVKMCCAGSTNCTTVIDGNSPSPTLLDSPYSIALDSKLNLYVTSKSDSSVYRYDQY